MSEDTAQESLSCRIDDSGAPDVLVAVLGEVETPLSQGQFDPQGDRVVLGSGGVVDHYFRDRLGIRHFEPVAPDAMPPPGWCTWAYYGRDVTAEEVLLNARWFAEHGRAYGLRLILIDDGWQGDHRDWTATRRTFPQGMKWLADRIRELGLLPGLWICPFGQDNEKLVRESGHFMFHADGRSVCGTMGGPYTIDPTKPGALDFVAQLVRQAAREWGYGHLKLDGIHSESLGYGVREAYVHYNRFFRDPSVDGRDAFRRLMKAILKGAGPGVTVGGCTLCFDAVGVCHTMRTGSDVHNEWHNGFLNAVASTMNGYFLHRIGWISDPDYCMLGAPLTFPMAQAWASLHGVTGQFLLFADRMPDLPASRVDLLKRITPPAPIRPFDLFPATRPKPVIDLKVAHQGRRYDVVAAFNYDERRPRMQRLDFERLGLKPGARYHVYDYWNAERLGTLEAGVFLEIDPAACRLVTLCEEGDFPVLLSTSRHVVQGWPDLEAFRADPKAGVIEGTSRVLAGERYALVFGLPQGNGRTFTLRRFGLDTGEPVRVLPHRGWVEVSWTPAGEGGARWQASFETAEHRAALHPGACAYMIGARDVDPWTVELFWMSFGSPAAFAVEQDGRLLGYTFSNRAVVGGLRCGAEHTFAVRVADLDGTRFDKPKTVTVTVGDALPAVLSLSDLPWEAATTGYRFVQRDRAVGGGGLTTGGRRSNRGIGSFPPSRIVYRLEGLFTRLTGACGIEDQNGAPADRPPDRRGIAVFRILGDGRELLAPVTRVHGQPAHPFAVDLSGIRELALIIERPDAAEEERSFAPHANWLDMRAERALPGKDRNT